MKTAIGRKLALSFTPLIDLMILTGLLSYWMVSRINKDVIHLLEIEEPLEDSLHEMEISVGKMGREVLDYVREREVEHRERAHLAPKARLFPHALVIERRTKNFG